MKNNQPVSYTHLNQPDTAKESIRFLKGVSFGEAAGGKPCGIVDLSLIHILPPAF